MANMFLVAIWLAIFLLTFGHWLIWMYCFEDPNNTDSSDQEMNQFCADLLTSVREMKSGGGTFHISFSPGPVKNID